MKNLTDLINENSNAGVYEFTATVKVTGKLNADSEGDAGEYADAKMDVLSNLVHENDKKFDCDLKVGEWTMDVKKAENESVVIDNNKILESQETDELVKQMFQDIINKYEEARAALPTDYYRAYLETSLRQYFNGQK